MGGGGRVVERFCADPVARSVNHPPTQPGPWSAGQLAPLERRRGRWAGLGEGENLLQMFELLP